MYFQNVISVDAAGSFTCKLAWEKLAVCMQNYYKLQTESHRYDNIRNHSSATWNVVYNSLLVCYECSFLVNRHLSFSQPHAEVSGCLGCYGMLTGVLTMNDLIFGNKMPTRCNRGFYCRSYCLLNMFRAPLCPSSGAQEYYTVVAACGILCCGFFK